MDKIGPKEAADTIRAEFENEHVDPRFHHQVRFAGDVLAELGKERSIENTAKVMRLLTVHGIEGHAYADFPKWVTNDRGEKAVVNDEEHEAAFMARPEPMLGDEPNPEHGHVDPQSGEFHIGSKPVEYDDHAEMEPELVGPDADEIDAERRRVEDERNAELVAAQERAAAERKQAEVTPDPTMNRAEQIKAEQDRIAAADKAAKDEREKLAALQK